MSAFKNFNVAAYVHAEFLHFAELSDIEKGIAYFAKYLPLDKVYLETHRGLYDIPTEKMEAVKALFQKHGIRTSGGITSTIKIDGHEKNSIFDVFCYTDPVYREKYLEIVKQTAELFDEVILDDFFFTACRCELCIEAKGAKSWAQYRLDLMEEMAHKIVDLAKEVNPDINFIIKYPNWYESYQECGYNPGKQRNIFDNIYTGTESRNPRYDQQHLQRYLSYSLIRLLENAAPGHNGGGWIDQGSSSDNLNVWLEQACLTVFAGAKELMLFNFSELIESPVLPPLGQQLNRIDPLMGQVGRPTGAAVYEPFDANGEDQLMNYLGMTGIALEPSPDFNEEATVVFLPASAACDAGVMEKLERYVRKGGNAIVTNGFMKAVYDKGIKEMTSVRLTGRHVSGKEYWIDSYYTNHKSHCGGMEEIRLEALDYKTNATWCEIAVVDGDCSFPLLLDDFYGQGHLYVLNIPDNFSDLYRLPKQIAGSLGKVFGKGGKVYLEAEAKYNLFLYDNDMFGVQSYRPYTEDLDIIVCGEEYTGIKDLETGEIFRPCGEKIRPVKRFDSAKTQDEPVEKIVRVPFTNGTYRFFGLVTE